MGKALTMTTTKRFPCHAQVHWLVALLEKIFDRFPPFYDELVVLQAILFLLQ
jgi:hypothetical protein